MDNAIEGMNAYQLTSTPQLFTKYLSDMKRWGLFFLLFLCAACHKDNQESVYYISLSENKISADYWGDQKRIEVSSNCDWKILNIPNWCIVEKAIENNKEYLKVEVLSNDMVNPRNATILLVYDTIASPLFISQNELDQVASLQWYTFPVNSFINVKFDVQNDNITRRYQILSDELFVNSALKEQIFPGNIINSQLDNILSLKDYYKNFTYNPIILGSNNGKVKELSKPSFDGLNKFAQEIIADLPEQNYQFKLSSPLQYKSHRHLHLLGVGNMGLNLDEMISGKSYLEQEMEHKTGMLYTFSQEMFFVVMDYPQRLINETISESELSTISYINSITYGKTALLLIEASHDFVAMKKVVTKIAENKSLSNDELLIRNDLDVWYLFFDKSGEHLMKGDYTLIGRYVDESKITSERIIPLYFTTNRLKDHSVGNIKILLELP